MRRAHFRDGTVKSAHIVDFTPSERLFCILTSIGYSILCTEIAIETFSSFSVFRNGSRATLDSHSQSAQFCEKGEWNERAADN